MDHCFIGHCFIGHWSLFTVCCPLITVHCSLFTVYCPLITVHCSLVTVHCSRSIDPVFHFCLSSFFVLRSSFFSAPQLAAHQCDWEPKQCKLCGMQIIARDIVRHEEKCANKQRAKGTRLIPAVVAVVAVSREFYWTDFGTVVGGVYFLFFSPFLLSVSSPSSRSPFWFFQSNHRRRRRRRHGRTPLLFVWGLRLFSLCAVHFQPRSSQPPPPDLCHLWPRSFVPSSKCASDGGDRRCRLLAALAALAALAVLAVLVVVCLLLWMDAHSLVPLFFLSSSSLLPLFFFSCSSFHPPPTHHSPPTRPKHWRCVPPAKAFNGPKTSKPVPLRTAPSKETPPPPPVVHPPTPPACQVRSGKNWNGRRRTKKATSKATRRTEPHRRR